MISKFSVKKPLTVIMALFMVFILGYVAFTNMKTDLLPNMDLPYIAIITPYMGGAPEKVELSLTKPLEQILAKTNGVKEMQSVSAENYSLIILEFTEGTNLDSAIIEISSNASQITNQLGDEVSSPIYMKINPDLLPIVIASIDYNGVDRQEIARRVESDIIPPIERTDGVAAVSATGLIENTMKITISDEKLAELNDRIIEAVDEKLLETEKELKKAERELKSGKEELEKTKNEQNENLATATVAVQNGMTQLLMGKDKIDTIATLLDSAFEILDKTDEPLQNATAYADSADKYMEDVSTAVNALRSVLSTAYNSVDTAISKLDGNADGFEKVYAALTEIRTKLGKRISDCDRILGKIDASQTPSEIVSEIKKLIRSLRSDLKDLKKTMKSTGRELDKQYGLLQEQAKTLEKGKFTYTEQITLAQSKLDDAEAQLSQGREAFEEAKADAYKAAGLDGAITIDTVSGLIQAENFSMPVGTINDKNVTYAVKVGNKFADNTELEDWELFNIQVGNIGVIKLEDIADIEYLDNSGDMYARVNGNDGILLTIDKQSTYSTTDVCHSVQKTFAELEKQYDGLTITALSDQGEYIDIVIMSVLEALAMGGFLAILILLVFLKDVRPTVIIAISIPSSLLFAVVLMYFTNVSLNIISLAGLALGVGMLVDNSIVVVENIYRLKALGMPIKDACIDGTRQVGGAIIASTLTTVSVFLPIVFTTGITKQIFSDMGLTIAYSLLASLIVALTLVPSLSSLMLKTAKPKSYRAFDAVINGYIKGLNFTLSHKALLFVSVLLLMGLAVFGATQMGTEFIPATDSNQITATIEMPEGTSAEDARKMSEKVIERIADIDDIETIAAMQGGSGMLGMMSTRGNETAVSVYILLKENRKQTSQEVGETIQERTKDMECYVSVESSSLSMDMLTGSGLSIVIKGTDLDNLQKAATDIGKLIEDIEGTVDVKTGLEDAKSEVRIVVDKNAAMAKGYTVAQVYMKVAEAVKTQSTATSIDVGSDEYAVIVAQTDDKNITIEGLRNLELEVTDLMSSAQQNTRELSLSASSDAKDSDGETEKVKLSEIADIQMTDTPSEITHQNQMRTMTVTAGVDANHNIGKISARAESIIKNYNFPGDCYYETEGENEYITQALSDLSMMLIISVTFIYMIMVAQFQSLKSPFIVMFTIPLAFTGGILLLWVLGFNISVISMIGLLVLAGVVVNNGIVFVDYTNQLREEGMEMRQALLETGKARIRPIIMTAITTILGLTTIALGIGQGTDMLQPLGIVVIGGLFYATMLTLFVIPALYELFNRKRTRKGGENA